MGVRVVTRSRYLSGFIGEQESEKVWLAEKLDGWAHPIEGLDGVTQRHVQTAYSGLKKSLQQEWAFVQHVTLYIWEALCPVE